MRSGYCAFRVNWFSKEGDLKSYEESFSGRPNGDPMAALAEDGEDVVIGEADLEQVRWVRRQWPFLRERRPATTG